MIQYSGQEHYYIIDNLLLRSCHQIRNLLRIRWRKETGNEWVDGKNQGTEFVRKCANIYKQSPKPQQDVISKGCLEEWDLSLLSKVLHDFGNSKENKNESVAVLALRDVRNHLAHHPSKNLSLEEYSKNLATVKGSLLVLGLPENEVEKEIQNAGITSSVQALNSVKLLFEKAKNHEKKEDFEAAIDCYTEAISIPSLLPVNQGAAYENRACCYLKQRNVANTSEEDRNNLRKQAMLDSTEALELNEYSWNAHYLAGQCHQIDNKLTDAIHHYQRALAISPAQIQVKTDLDVCKVLSASQERHDHLDPDSMPINLTDRVAYFERMTGINFTEEDFLEMTTTLRRRSGCPGEDHVFRAHQYEQGWKVAQDYSKACRHFAKAAEVGKAEGIYNLGLCYEHGRGVGRDIPKAYRYFKQAAEMSADTPGKKTTVPKNIGVAFSQHSLGLMYQHGIHVEQNFVKAAAWYSKAAENGAGNAANNLGWMYFHGTGVAKDEKMAEMYWNQGVIFGDVIAVASLMSHYINHLELEKAMVLFDTAKVLGGHLSLLNVKKEDFEKMLYPAKLRREQLTPKDLVEFENEHKLDSKGHTYLERLQRRLSLRSELDMKWFQLLKNVESEERWGGMFHVEKLSDPNAMKCIGEKGELGSITAIRLIKTLRCAVEVMNFPLYEKCATEDNERELVELLYKGATLEFHAFFLPTEIRESINKILGGLFQKYCSTKGDFDMKIRFCFVAFNLAGSLESKDKFSLEVMKEGIRRYPNNPHYYKLLSDFFCNKKEFHSGLQYAREGLILFPENISLLYNQAFCLHISSESRIKEGVEIDSETIAAYKEFLKKAPCDHRKLPEAYYTLACEYLRKDTEKAEHYYNEGLSAEKNQLPCYLPYQCSERKNILKFFIEARNKELQVSKNPSAKVHTEQKSASVLERKPYLNDPVRKLLLLEHRKKVVQIFFTTNNCTMLAPRLKQTCAKKMSHLKKISLKEMNPTCDHIYEDCILELRVIEDACLGLPSIHLLAEDENGDVTRLYLYNVEQNRESHEEFGFGRRIAIINPYMRINGYTHGNGIRNDEPKCILPLEKVKNMCRFCGEEGAPRKCSKCERAYCSRECQKLDWKMFEHKLICKLKVDVLREKPLSNIQPYNIINPYDFNFKGVFTRK